MGAVNHGVSIPLGKGFRYAIGGPRGRVASRTEIRATDSGVLSVTSKRVLFTGATTTLEVPYRRLVRIQVFEDAIQFHMTGRKSAPLIRVDAVHAIAATLGTAKARLG